MIRLFVALGLPEMVRQRLALVRAPLNGARWVPAENMHVTLRFIGNIDEPVANEIDDRLARIEAAPFELKLNGLGTFGSRGRVRTLWAGVERNPALEHLQTKVENACMRAGLPPEKRRFHAHVTLARCKDTLEDKVSGFVATYDGRDIPAVPVDEFVLYSSHTGRAGAIYTPEATYPLTRP